MLLGTCTCALLVIGLYSQGRAHGIRSQERAARAAEVKLQEDSNALQTINVTFTAKEPQRVFMLSYPQSLEVMVDGLAGWSSLETSDTVLVNDSAEGATVCPEALIDFMVSYSPLLSGTTQHTNYGIEISDIRRYASQLSGRSAAVQVRIPRYEGPPKHLERCLEVGWDASTHRLTYHGKPIAVLMAKQPALETLAPAKKT